MLSYGRTAVLVERGAQRYLAAPVEADGSPPGARLPDTMTKFGLTPAEQRLAQFLAYGGRLSGAAQAFGVSCHTVRNQLRSVFEKVGVHRQAELVRLMWCGSMTTA
ncbi:MAG: helix-turn-helix transcriptional regulator [Alphaproteobacteria bacterium]|nr:helix-turn-helix transcriptional regulator [Alphaproteobacteria bacterium]